MAATATRQQSNELISRLTPNSLGPAVNHMLDVQIPLFIWGPPGVGKSDIVRQIAAARGLDVIDVRLSQMEHADLRGIPYLDRSTGKMVEDNVMRWAPPDFLPRDPDTKAIIFLDEFSSVSNSQMLAACYQLLLDRRVGNYKLPDGVSLIAAGNRITDRGIAFRLPTPIANRMVHVELVANTEEWLGWAIQNRVHPDVVGFISFSKGSLAVGFDSAAPDMRGFATPRSWVAVSRILKQIKPEAPLDINVLRSLVAGAVGDGETIRFMDHRSRAAALPNPRDVMEGKIDKYAKAEHNRDPGLGFSLTTGVIYELEDANEQRRLNKISNDQFRGLVDNFFNFALNSFQPEVAVMAIRNVTTRAPKFQLDVRTVPNFGKIRAKFASILHRHAAIS